MELALEVLSRPALFSLVGTCLSLADLFKLQSVSRTVRGIFCSQSDSFWRFVITRSLDYGPLVRNHTKPDYGPDVAKRTVFRWLAFQSFDCAPFRHYPAHIAGLYPSCSGFVYSHRQFPQLYELDMETLRRTGEESSTGCSLSAPTWAEGEEVPPLVPWHLLAWDLMFLDELVRSYGLSEDGESLLFKDQVAHACMFRREAGTAVTVDEAARQVGMGVRLRHRLIVFRLEELIKGYEISQARTAEWTPESPIRHPMETQPFNYALPPFQRIGDADNTLAFSTVHFDRLPDMRFTISWNVMFMLRVSPWTGNWIGVCCPMSKYACGYVSAEVLPHSMEEALSSVPVREYHEAEQWLQMVNMKTNNNMPYFVYPKDRRAG
eukprot:GILK01000729.1.p1 GENE.GILK01000729.1~~GILK01000729.1.p1  ORF type:complete len:378 (-),score=47.23 GILK01000729.1:229-1362(-)